MVIKQNIHTYTFFCVLFCLMQFLTGCAATTARVDFEFSNKYEVSVPEKKEYVYIDDFYREDSSWNNDWIVYTKDKNVDYHVEFTSGDFKFDHYVKVTRGERDDFTSGLSLMSSNSWNTINKLLSICSGGIIPYYNKAEMPLYIEIEDKKNNFTTKKQIGTVSVTLSLGLIASLISSSNNASEAMSDKQVELTSNIAYQLYNQDSEFNQKKT